MRKEPDQNAGGAASAAAPESQRAGARERAAVWIVDDSALQAEMSQRALSAQYDVTVFQGGAALLETLATSPAPDVLVLDWLMPDVSGVEVCRYVRRTMDLARLPILILTATGSSGVLVEALAAGANDFVAKPFSEPELIARVSALARMASLHARLAAAEQRLRVEADFRERFMGMLAHDLRQPLSAIFMAGHALSAAESTNPRTPTFLAMQLRAAERMKRMIAELLDFTRNRPESGMPIQRQLTDFAEITRASVEEIRLAHPDHPLTLTVEGPCSGYWDPDRLAQICSNLIGNAFEHSAPTSVIEVRLSSTAAESELRVSNFGSVIPKETLDTLFLPFRRGRGQKPGSNGVGLGLHIVHEIVRAHGGSIAVESENAATHFLVSLPRNLAAAAAPRS